MVYNKPIRRIAIVGTGVIGASWAAQYLARGFDVIATDPAPNAEAALRKYVDAAWKSLADIGLSPGANRDRLRFTTNLATALAMAAQADHHRWRSADGGGSLDGAARASGKRHLGGTSQAALQVATTAQNLNHVNCEASI